MIKLLLEQSKPISKRLYGIFLEDINCAADGGLNADLICNPYFYALSREPVKNKDYYLYKIFHKHKRKLVLHQVEKNHPLFGWEYSADVTYPNEKPVFHVNGEATLQNKGFAGIGITEGHTYQLTFTLSLATLQGEITVGLYDEDDAVSNVEKCTNVQAKEYSFVFTAKKTGSFSFCFTFRGTGELSFTEVRLYDKDSFDFNGQNPDGGRMRSDLVKTLKDLHPAFMRFPGGCIVEGYNLKNAYRWKDTVGSLAERKPKYNLWGESYSHGVSMQNYEIGFYEYFLLCEHLGTLPMPILNAGLGCQGRCNDVCNQEDLDIFCQDVLDLIEYATGDTGFWATKRKKSGHEKPFLLRTVGVGNENWGEDYQRNFMYIYTKVREKYPDIEIIFTNGYYCYNIQEKVYDESRKFFDGQHLTKVFSDDHFYRRPNWLIEHENLYDSYDRSDYPVYLGEYAANGYTKEIKVANTYISALSEAVFLTGLERNADIVQMASYAPLLSRVGFAQWNHNLLNFDGLSVLRTANYYVQKLFMTNIGDTYIPCQNDDKDLYFSFTKDKKYIYAKVVSLSREEKEIDFPLQGKCEHTFMFGNDLDVNTTAQEKVFPKTEQISLAETVKIAPRSINIYKIPIK